MALLLKKFVPRRFNLIHSFMPKLQRHGDFSRQCPSTKASAFFYESKTVEENNSICGRHPPKEEEAMEEYDHFLKAQGNPASAFFYESKTVEENNNSICGRHPPKEEEIEEETMEMEAAALELLDSYDLFLKAQGNPDGICSANAWDFYDDCDDETDEDEDESDGDGDGDDNEVMRAKYDSFLVEMEKSYNTPEEKERRFRLFKKRVRDIEKHNSICPHPIFYQHINWYTDMTLSEMGLTRRLGRRQKV